MSDRQHPTCTTTSGETLRETEKPSADQRPVPQRFCLFGLPVDNLTMSTTKNMIRKQAPQKRQLVLSTININWVARALSDPTFRDTVRQSDILTIDGKPLVWIARLFGYLIPETVPGSTLIQELLHEKSDRPLTLFLFGGNSDAAQTAMEKINRNPGGLRAVGAMNPGYGTVAEMSSNAIIDTINARSPDILLVALGAAKGTAWIQHNRHRLDAGVISHLGATVNFLAGTVQRAPRFMQSYGLEWLWRIYQEPKLFTRYLEDGLDLGRHLLSRLPLIQRYRQQQRRYAGEAGGAAGDWLENDRRITISLGRLPRPLPGTPLCAQIEQAARAGKDIRLDFQATDHLDGAFLARLLTLRNYAQRAGHRLQLVRVHQRIAEIFDLFDVRDLLPGGSA